MMTTKIITGVLAFLFYCSGFLTAQMPLSIEDPAMDAWAADPAHRPVLTGKLVNYTEEDLKNNPITCYFPMPILNYSRDIRLKVGADGSFKYQLPYAVPNQQFAFNFGELYYCNVLVTEDVHIELDVVQLKKDTSQYVSPGVRFSGKDGASVRLLNEFYQFTENTDIALSTEKQQVINSTLAPEEKVAKLRLLYKAALDNENRFFETHDKKNQTIIASKRESDFYADILLVYLRNRTEMPANLWEEVVAHQPIGINNSGQEYYRVLGSYATIIQKKLLESEILKKMPVRKSEMVILAGQSKFYDTMEQKEYYELGIPALHGSLMMTMAKNALQEVESTLAEIKSREAKATVRPNIDGPLPGIPYKSYQHGADLYTSGYGDIDSLFGYIRSLYPDKAIVFDVWTTWCGPCKSDMKESKPKKSEIKKAELPLEIIYLCAPIRSSLEKWAFIINENEFTGTYFYLNTMQAKQLKERYKVNHFPTYLTFNRKGEQIFDAVEGISNIDVEALRMKI